MKPYKLPSHLDARGLRGIMSRGYAKYGVSNAPKPGKIENVQDAARRRLKKLREAQKKHGN